MNSKNLLLGSYYYSNNYRNEYDNYVKAVKNLQRKQPEEDHEK